MDKENKINIFIVGNGFDLAHGLKTSYRDFLEYLVEDLKLKNSVILNDTTSIYFSLQELSNEKYKLSNIDVNAKSDITIDNLFNSNKGFVVDFEK